jgi:hypothetical protein
VFSYLIYAVSFPPELQREILRLVSNGQNVFFTGNAGTGKSFLLNQIIASLRTQYELDFTDAVAVTAATGIAATHIGGASPFDCTICVRFRSAESIITYCVMSCPPFLV